MEFSGIIEALERRPKIGTGHDELFIGHTRHQRNHIVVIYITLRTIML